MSENEAAWGEVNAEAKLIIEIVMDRQGQNRFHLNTAAIVATLAVDCALLRRMLHTARKSADAKTVQDIDGLLEELKYDLPELSACA